jgi:nucleotide-binding universal stress UspA family protein
LISKILVGVDGSPSSTKALSWAAEIASKWDALLLIISVIPPLTPLVYMGAAPMYIEEYDRVSRIAKQKIIDEAVKFVRGKSPDLKVETRISKGRPSEIIQQTVREENVDLIVLGSKGIGGVTGWFLGSTSSKVVNVCEKPVLIIK